MLKTINIPASIETTVTAKRKYLCAYIENQGTADIYASKNPSVVADADDVMRIKPGETKQLLCESDKVYLLSSAITKAEILFSDYLNLNFRKYLKGGEKLKNALKDNLNITADANLNSIVSELEDNKYRIKDLDSKNFETISLGGSTSQIVDNKIFIFGSYPQNHLIEVFDIMTLTKITTINTGSNAPLTTSLAVDNNFIYFTKLTLVSTNRSVRILKYDRRTLAFVSESPVVYTSINIVSYVMTSFHHNGFIFLGISEPDGGNIIKVSLTDYSTAKLPYNAINVLYKISTGFFAMGTGTALGTDNFRKPQFIDFNLNIIQYLPITLLATAQTRLAVQKDDYIYIANDAGVVTKYQISTNTIVEEVTIIDIGQIRGLQLVNNGILVQSNKSIILLYDFSLNLIKTWSYYNAITAGGFMLMDNNFTIYTHSHKDPNFYKKQFIDMTKGII